MGDPRTNINRKKPFLYDVAVGSIEGHSVISKFGENPDVDSGDGFLYMWDNAKVAYVPPTQARLHNIASTLANDAGTVLSSGNATGGSANTIVDTGATFQTDTVAAGDFVLNDDDCVLGRVLTVDSETQLTVERWAEPNNGLVSTPMSAGKAYRVVTTANTGASIFFVRGLGATFLEQDEFVVLNGQSNVATAKTYTRQYRARVFGASAIGVITSTAQTDGTVTCQIIDGNNQTLMAIYTVPANKIGYLIKWWGTLSRAITTISQLKLRIGELAGVGYVTQTRSISSAGSSGFEYEFDTPIVIPGGADIWIEANASANNSGVSGGFEILLIDN